MRTLALVLFAVASFANTSASGADWSGDKHPHDFSVGGVIGLAGLSGFGIIANVAKPVTHNGFIPDVDDTASVELQIGPVLGALTGVLFSLHLQWAFHKDSLWSFYGLGGISGSSIGVLTMRPRTGLGALYWVSKTMAIRGEYSLDVLGVGVHFTL